MVKEGRKKKKDSFFCLDHKVAQKWGKIYSGWIMFLSKKHFLLYNDTALWGTAVSFCTYSRHATYYILLTWILFIFTHTDSKHSQVRKDTYMPPQEILPGAEQVTFKHYQPRSMAKGRYESMQESEPGQTPERDL